jgi:hypothetical protein
MEKNNLKLFYQFGFKKVSSSGKHAIGNCIFCKKDKFYINEDNGLWDCKVCGMHGGYKTFVEEIYQVSLKHRDLNLMLKNLSEHRGIDKKQFEKWGWFNGYFTIPYFYNNEFRTIRLYDYEIIRNVVGANIYLYQEDQLGTKVGTVWLCEGEWDALVMNEVLKKQNILTNNIVVAVPGATQFKAEWKELFRDKSVNVLFDNDLDREVNGRVIEGAGKTGSKKVFAIIKSVVREVKFIHWEEGLKNGFDVRDLYKKLSYSSEKLLAGLNKRLKPLPPGLTEIEQEKVLPVKYKGSGVSHKEVYRVYQKWLHLIDTDVVDIIYGTIIANRMPGDPVWIFLVGKSGDAKSVFIMSISSWKEVVAVSSMTPASLISGYGMTSGQDFSLLPKLNNKILAIKDFTTILNGNPLHKDEISSILRDAYDGKATRSVGTGLRTVESKFGMIAGVTPAIELFIENQTAFGERCLKHKIQETDDLEIERILCRKAMENSSLEDQMQHELRDIAQQALNFDFSSVKIEVCREMKEKIIFLSQWAARLRGSIIRDKFSKEITHRPFIERPTRLAKQLYKLLIGICQFRHKVEASLDEYKILCKTAISTVPPKIEIILGGIFNKDRFKEWSMSEIRQMSQLPEIATQETVSGMCVLEILTKEKESESRFKYKLSDLILNLTRQSSVYGERSL